MRKSILICIALSLSYLTFAQVNIFDPQPGTNTPPSKPPVKVEPPVVKEVPEKPPVEVETKVETPEKTVVEGLSGNFDTDFRDFVATLCTCTEALVEGTPEADACVMTIMAKGAAMEQQYGNELFNGAEAEAKARAIVKELCPHMENTIFNTGVPENNPPTAPPPPPPPPAPEPEIPPVDPVEVTPPTPPAPPVPEPEPAEPVKPMVKEPVPMPPSEIKEEPIKVEEPPVEIPAPGTPEQPEQPMDVEELTGDLQLMVDKLCECMDFHNRGLTEAFQTCGSEMDELAKAFEDKYGYLSGEKGKQMEEITKGLLEKTCPDLTKKFGK